ncbi:MAG: peptidylprolyl isomerase [Prevotella sp.]|nr:peptidylprolyl isomerase [Prevotella sp.]
MKKMLFAALLMAASVANAQTKQDPVIMTVNGQPVLRSEFEYSFNKNNAEGVIDKKNVEEYVDLFINYKLKVEAAKDANLDTLSSFKDEFASYRDQQVRPTFINDADVEEEAQRIYADTKHRIDSMGGMVKPAHILLMLGQKATEEQQKAAKTRIDSIAKALKGGADFAELARRLSDDKPSAIQGGELPWFTKGQTLPEFEKTAFAMTVGQVSEPVLTPAGYHIIKLLDKGSFFPYDSVRTDIMQFINQRNLRESIIDKKLEKMAEAEGTTPQALVEKKMNEMTAKDQDLKYLIQEYHDGLLLYEISNQKVWGRAAKDEAGLAAFFSKNKKKYAWDEPRFKGMAYHVKDKADVKAVKNAVKGLPFDKWAEKLRTTFNNDSVLRIRVEKGIFKPGDNGLVDREIFKKADATVKKLEKFPIDAVYGKKLKKPEEYQDVRGLVVADYQEALEKEWVAELRRKYAVTVDEKVLQTVNKH